MILNSKNVIDTQNFAKKLAEDIGKNKKRIFALTGDLGSGKTTFAQAFLRALGVKGKITSPTFLIIKNYELRIKNQEDYQKAYHIDCYRLKNPKELLILGFKEILKDKHNIILIEWADKIRDLLPAKAVQLFFEHGKKENERIIKML